MPRTRAAVKTNPYHVHIEALRRKQQELLDSYERDKAAGNQQPDDGIRRDPEALLGESPQVLR